MAKGKQETKRDKIIVKIRCAQGLLDERKAAADPSRYAAMIDQQLEIMRAARERIARIKDAHEKAKNGGVKDAQEALRKAKQELIVYNARKDVEKLEKLMRDAKKLGVEIGQLQTSQPGQN